MSNPLREDRGAALALALLRATLVVVIFVSEQLVDARQLVDSYFFVVLGVAAVYAVMGIAVVLRPSIVPGSGTLLRLQPGFDLLLLVGLTYTSGGAYYSVAAVSSAGDTFNVVVTNGTLSRTWTLASGNGNTVTNTGGGCTTGTW